VATWFVRDGDSVAADQLLAEVQVDKVAVEVPAPAAGTIRLLVPEEAVVTQGAVIARIE
jgi:pyruvate/2-oxoglutarate dehydrogenase complex dihydrolipoamide acyltransferase (E2) component